MTEFNLIGRVAEWNTTRDNLLYSPSLEYSMLDEELEEFMEAGQAKDKVAEADALGDLAWVAIGGLVKLCNGDTTKVKAIFRAIADANDTKSKSKNEQGKITKPKDFKGPEAAIKAILSWDRD